jgi:hypothetical protein
MIHRAPFTSDRAKWNGQQKYRLGDAARSDTCCCRRAVAVAIGAGGFDEAVDFGIGQVFPRRTSALCTPDCPNKVAGATSARCNFAIGYWPFSNDPSR